MGSRYQWLRRAWNPHRQQARDGAGSDPVPPGSRTKVIKIPLIFVLLISLTACRQKATQIIVETAPLPRQEGERTSYAGVVSNVAPSVVSVYVHMDLRGKTPAALHSNPALRNFFDEKNSRGRPGTPQELEGLGSGVVISPDGYILTNSHVVEDADKITVTTTSGEEFKAKVVGTDPATDIAVLKVDARNLPAVILADSNQLRVGDIVLAIGNPFGVGQTVTSGIVSATEREGFGITEYEDFIQTDAAINPGNSGGALVDARGRLVGINTVILSSGGGFEGIGLAVPINLASNVTQQIMTHGKVVRGYLGVALRPLTAELAKALKMPHRQGALVVKVMPNSPASRAGLREGDIIIGVNNRTAESSRELRMLIADTPPGSRATLKVRRIGEEKALTATLGELPRGQSKAGLGG